MELNSKWYWRFIKVIWIILILLVLSVSSAWFYEYTKTYEPADIKKVSDEISEYYWKYKKLGDSILSLSWSYQAKELRKITYIRNWEYEISIWTILYILAHSLHPNIEGVLYLTNKDNDYYHRCPTDSCMYYNDSMSDDLSDYMQSGSTLYVTSDDISKFTSYEKDLITLNNTLTEFQKGNSSFEDVYPLWKSFFGKDEHFYQTYRWFSEWINIIFWTIGIFIWLIIFSLVLRWISYYIILWKFNPEK